MRRKDREIRDKNEIFTIIKKARVCRLCINDKQYPYLVPLCFGYENDTLYFHSAPEGKKIDLLKKNNLVSFEIDISGNILQEGKQCDWDIEYQSIIGYGKAYILNDLKSKKEALQIILDHYSQTFYNLPEDKINNTSIIKVSIIEMNAKHSL